MIAKIYFTVVKNLHPSANVFRFEPPTPEALWFALDQAKALGVKVLKQGKKGIIFARPLGMDVEKWFFHFRDFLKNTEWYRLVWTSPTTGTVLKSRAIYAGEDAQLALEAAQQRYSHLCISLERQ